MMKKTEIVSKRLNLMMDNGLFVLSSKQIKGSPIAKLVVSNLTDTIRVMFDTQEKRIIANVHGVEITDNGVKELIAKLG